MASTYHADIQALYVAYFNRPADYLGLDFWEKAIENAVAAAGTDPAAQAAAKAATLAQISAGFAASDEYLDVYGGLATEQVIGQVYQNLFGHAPDLAGLVFWVEAVRGGHMTIANAVTTIAAGAQGTDKEAVENKVAAAVAFTNELDTGEEVLAYNNEDALTAAKLWMAGITTDASLAAAIAPAALKATVAAVVDAGTPEPEVVQHVLTAGIDTINGTAGNDVITGVISATAANTFTNLDTINGSTGNDVLDINMLDTAGGTIGTNVSVSNVETANVRSAGDATVNSTGWTGLNTLNVTQSAAATVTAAATTAVNVTGATGAVIVSGGSDVSVAGADTVTVDGSTNVTVAATGSGKNVTIGATTVVKGAVTVNHTKLAAGAIAVDGGTSVSITAAGQTTGTISVGQGGAAADLPSGAVTITATGAASVAGTDVTLGNIAVDGGTTVVIDQTATSSSAAAAADATGATITQSAVTVDGSSKTTSVTVNQDAAVSERLAVTAVAGANEVQTVTFGAMTAGQTLTINGLTFTASKALTAAQVAAAFSGLSNGAIVGSAPAGNGVYSGTFSTVAGSTSAVTTANGTSTVTFTSTSKADVALVTIAGTAAGTSAVETTVGAAATAGVTGRLGVANGTVTINGAITGTDVLATVNLDAYGTASVTSDALTALNLANSSAAVTVTNAAATSMTLGLNNVGSAINLGATYTTLTVTGSGDESATAITAGGVTALTVGGDQAIDLTGSALGALKTVVVNGSASLTADLSGATVTSVNAGSSSGEMVVSIDASKATYTGSTGADDVTLTSANVTKAVNTGAGNDLVELAAGTTGTSITVAINGGAGTDTLAMASATAAAASATDVFETKVEGFEKLHLGVVAAAATDVIDLANLDDISFVISEGNVGVELELNNMAANGTLQLNGNGVLVDVNLTDATGTADVFNIITSAAGDLTGGIVDVAGVETVNITATDTAASTINTHTLTLKDSAAKSAVLSGNANLNLSLDAGVTALTSVNGSAMTGALTYATNAAATGAQTVTGGAGADVLTANRNSDVLNGGAGNDTLIATADLNVLTGGAGNDTFNVADVTSNVNSYATITDLAAGDKIQFAVAADDFAAAKITLADTAVFQDYANAAITTTDTGDLSWFQFGGNTYVILNISNGTSFVNASDMIVKITGAVDLSTASFSSSSDILLIGGPSA